jgi:hypothetical protein
MRNYAAALERLGVSEAGIEFYAEHVRADARHEVVALHRLAGGFVEGEPELAPDVLFGAAALKRVEAEFARHILDAWGAGRSSLLAEGALAR